MTSVGFTTGIDWICVINHGRDNQRKLLCPGKHSEQICVVVI